MRRRCPGTKCAFRRFTILNPMTYSPYRALQRSRRPVLSRMSRVGPPFEMHSIRFGRVWTTRFGKLVPTS